MFIWGAGRTGSYLLLDLLSLHPGVLVMRTTAGRSAAGLFGKDRGTLAKHGHLLGGRPAPIESFPRLMGRTPAETRRHMLRFANGSRLVDKSPRYVWWLDHLEKAFPVARHVCCTRYEPAVVRSYVRRATAHPEKLDAFGFWGQRPPGWESMLSLTVAQKAEWCALETLGQARRNVAHLGNRATVVEYERLVDNPRGEVRRVLSFAGLRDADLPIPERFDNYNEKTHPSP